MPEPTMSARWILEQARNADRMASYWRSVAENLENLRDIGIHVSQTNGFNPSELVAYFSRGLHTVDTNIGTYVALAANYRSSIESVSSAEYSRDFYLRLAGMDDAEPFNG